jgi:hypothetical protein
MPKIVGGATFIVITGAKSVQTVSAVETVACQQKFEQHRSFSPPSTAKCAAERRSFHNMFTCPPLSRLIARAAATAEQTTSRRLWTLGCAGYSCWSAPII